MVNLLAVQNSIVLVLTLVLFGAKVAALVDSATRPDAVFVAAGKQTKPFWLLVLGLAVLVHLVSWAAPISLLNLAGTVAALVYLADVRPTVKSLTRR